MYPLSNLQQIKDENFQETLAELKNKIFQLERYKNFSEIRALLEKSKINLANEKDLDVITKNIKNIDDAIYRLIHPAKDKIKQLKIVMKLVEKYFDKKKAKKIIADLTKYYKILQKEIDSEIINKEEVVNQITKIDKKFADILKKMFEFLQNKKVTLDDVGFKSRIIKKYIAEQKNGPKNINQSFQNIESLESEIIKLEEALEIFYKTKAQTKIYEDEFRKIKLLESDNIKKVKIEFQSLLKNIKLLSPYEKSLHILNKGIIKLVQKLNELNKANKDELENLLKDKLFKINYLLESINSYFDPDETQSIVNKLHLQKNKIEDLEKNYVENFIDLTNLFTELDSVLVNELEKILIKIEAIYAEKELTPNYQTYFNNNIGLIKCSDRIEKLNADDFFKQFYDLSKFLKKFEISYQQFCELQIKLKNYKDDYFNIRKKLINSKTSVDIIKTIEQQIGILNKDFSDFDPQSNFLEQLNLSLIQLDTKLNELSKLNQVKLRNQQKQYAELIELLIDSKVNLNLHANKLKSNFLWAKSGKIKYQVIETIQKKIDALLELGVNQEDVRSNKQIISDLEQTLHDVKTILSEYRGITLLRCFATLWGGGKVTSQVLVETLEGQLSDLQCNINRLHA